MVSPALIDIGIELAKEGGEMVVCPVFVYKVNTSAAATLVNDEIGADIVMVYAALPLGLFEKVD